MSRYDKYDPMSGGTRALLANDFYAGTANAADPLNPANWNTLFGAYLDSNGAVKAPLATPVSGGLGTGENPTGALIGVYMVSDPKFAGDVVDIMTQGEVVNFDDGKYTGVVAGQDWYIDKTSGFLTHTAPAAGVNAFYVGTTVEAGRLVVRFRRGAMVGT